MCDITAKEISGEINNFEAVFENCKNEYGFIEVVLLKKKDKGCLYSIVGSATDETPIKEDKIIPNSHRINPSKVFKWIAKKLKDILCPTCM